MRCFRTDLARGQAGVSHFVCYLVKMGYAVQEHDLAEQHLGDLTVSLPDGRAVTCEVKRDEKAEQTGNLFIETWSNHPVKPGWVHTCEAELLVFLLPNRRTVYVMKFAELREHLDELISCSPRGEVAQRSAQQRNDTRGVPVPVAAFEQLIPSFKKWNV